MEAVLRDIAGSIATACEFAAVVFVALGAAEAVLRVAAGWRSYADLQLKKDIWRRFAGSIVLALEFALAADIARTAIAPTWRDIGQLAAIAAIRTGLNYFLSRDIDVWREVRAPPPAD